MLIWYYNVEYVKYYNVEYIQHYTHSNGIIYNVGYIHIIDRIDLIHIPFTRMPRSTNWRARPLVNATIAPLVAV